MDVKKIHPDSSGWDASVEQEIFGNQAPHASGAYSRFPSNGPNGSQVYSPHNLDPSSASGEEPTPYSAGSYIPQSAASSAFPDQISEHIQESLPEYRQESDSTPAAPPGVSVHPPSAPLAPSTIPPSLQPTQSYNPSQYALQSEQQLPPSPEQGLPRVQPSQEQNQRSIHNIVPLGQHTPEAHTVGIPSSSQSPPISTEQASPETLQSPQSYGAIASTGAGGNQQLPQQPQQSQWPQQYPTTDPTRHQRAKSNRGRRRNASDSPSDNYGSNEDAPLLPFRATKAQKKKSRNFYRTAVVFAERFGWILLMMIAAFMLLNRYMRPLIPEDACTRAARNPPEVSGYHFIFSPDANIVFKVLDGIAGDITIVENEVWSHEPLFFVEVTSTSSSQKALNLLTLDVGWPNNLLYFNTVLNPEMGPLEDQRELLRESCTRTNMTLFVPKGFETSLNISMETSQGEANLLLKSKLGALIREVQIKVTDGAIFVDSISVKGLAALTVQGNGTVSGKMLMNGRSRVTVDEGQIDIEVDTDLGLVGVKDKDLDLVLSTKKGPINLVQTRRFQGRFDLSSGLGHVVLDSHNQNNINYTEHSNEHSLKGWITKDGSEPADALPRIKATAGEGHVHVIIQK